MYNEWDHIPFLNNVREVPLQNVHVRVKKFCHITHNKTAGEIDREHQDYFEFKPAVLHLK